MENGYALRKGWFREQGFTQCLAKHQSRSKQVEAKQVLTEKEWFLEMLA